MGTATFSNDLNPGAVAQITGRGYPFKEFSDRLRVSQDSLYASKRQFAKASSGEAENDAEMRRLRVRIHNQ